MLLPVDLPRVILAPTEDDMHVSAERIGSLAILPPGHGRADEMGVPIPQQLEARRARTPPRRSRRLD